MIKKKESNPMSIIRISMLDEKETISEFDLEFPCTEFKFDSETYEVNGKKGKTFIIDNNLIYLKFIKNGYIPHLFYNVTSKKPVDFKNRNKNIPSRALKLLWNTNMYRILFTPELDRTNKLIILLMIGNIIAIGVTLYLKYR
jgi:hypothetical protein